MLNETGLVKRHKVLDAEKWVIIRSIGINTFVDYSFSANEANAWAGEKRIPEFNQRQTADRLGYNNTPDIDLEEPYNRLREWLNDEAPQTQPATLDREEAQVQNLKKLGNRLREWFNDEDPQTQPATLDREEVQVQELIYRFRKLLSIPYRQKLAERLLSLFNNAKEEDPDSLGIATGSLHDFYDFLRLHNNLKYPSIFLTPDENIYATWKSNQNRVFSVHFLSNRDVRFVIFKPNKNDPKRIFRSSGTATTDTLMDDIFSDSLDWITE